MNVPSVVVSRILAINFLHTLNSAIRKVPPTCKSVEGWVFSMWLSDAVLAKSFSVNQLQSFLKDPEAMFVFVVNVVLENL